MTRRIGLIFGGERGWYWCLTGIDVDPDVTKKRIPYLFEMVAKRGGTLEVFGHIPGNKKAEEEFPAPLSFHILFFKVSTWFATSIPPAQKARRS